MCRLLGVASSEATDFRFSLRAAPRSLAVLSPKHPDGWGVAVHDDVAGWTVVKHAGCAGEDERFATAIGTRGRMLLAHVRKRTVGAVSAENTHPFRRGRWVFAHNGTIEDTRFIAEHTSAARRAEIEGATDSERLFAYLLTALDGCVSADDVPAALERAMRAAIAEAKFSANFLLADGACLYAHRHGRELCLLQRGQGDNVRRSLHSQRTGALLETPWSERRWAVFVASEQLTDEPWIELAEGSLLRVDGGAFPTWELVGSTC
jgi:predicted glutamine amidotransferase